MADEELAVQVIDLVLQGAGRTLLQAQDIEDVEAFLITLKK